ncbi:MAG: peptidoglycan editing factor PgeF [Gudongella sp.]|nr:peptidoglycan editing factor PgeF [Gudongella sp.]
MEYKIVEKNGYRYITIPELTELGLKHAFTTIDMDIGMSTNKNIENLKKNVQEVYDFLDVQPKILYNAYQTHSSNVAIIENLEQGIESQLGRYFPDTDGLITRRDDIALITRFADCVPILLFDKTNKVMANIHSGWKGTLKEITKQAIYVMKRSFNSDPKDIVAVIGPAIGRDDFEVQIDVASQFKDKFIDWEDTIRKKNEIKYLIDLQEINKRILLDSGIQEKNLSIIDLSTYKEKEIFHSFRRDGEKFGLMGLVSVLKL